MWLFFVVHLICFRLLSGPQIRPLVFTFVICYICNIGFFWSWQYGEGLIHCKNRTVTYLINDVFLNNHCVDVTADGDFSEITNNFFSITRLAKPYRILSPESSSSLYRVSPFNFYSFFFLRIISICRGRINYILSLL